MRQGTVVIAKQDILMRRHGGRGRPVSVKQGDEFWVTTPEYSTIIKIDRKGKGSIGNGYAFDMDTLLEYFEIKG